MKILMKWWMRETSFLSTNLIKWLLTLFFVLSVSNAYAANIRVSNVSSNSPTSDGFTLNFTYGNSGDGDVSYAIWTSDPGTVTSGDLKAGTGATTTAVLTGTLSVTTAIPTAKVITGLTSGTTYYIRATGLGNGGASNSKLTTASTSAPAAGTYGSNPTLGGNTNLSGTVGSSQTTPLTISETGGANPIKVKLTSTPSNFTITGLTTTDTTINASGSLSVIVGCTAPAVASPLTETLSITSDATGSPFTYTMNCTGTTAVGTYDSSPASSDTINLTGTVGTSLSSTLTINETGGSNPIKAKLTANPTNFSITGLTTTDTTINASGSQSVIIGCTAPAVASPLSETLSITSDATGSPFTYTVNCTGTAAPVVTPPTPKPEPPPTPPPSQPPGPPPAPVTLYYNLFIRHLGAGEGYIRVTDQGKEYFFPEKTECNETRTDCTYTVYNGRNYTLTPQPADDNKFVGWGGFGHQDCKDGEVSMFSSLLCQPTFIPIPYYDLAVAYGGRGNGTVEYSSRTYPKKSCTNTENDICKNYVEQSTVSLTAKADVVNSVFTGWSGDCKGKIPRITLKMTNAKNCTANFDLLPSYNVNITYGGTGKGTVTTDPEVPHPDCTESCVGAYVQGRNTVVNLLPQPDETSAFAEWKGEEDCLDGQIIVDKEKNCLAIFQPAYTFIIDKTGSGAGKIISTPSSLNCGDAETSCTANFIQGANISLQAISDKQSAFAGWQGDGCNGQMVMYSHRQCTATFIRTGTAKFTQEAYEISEDMITATLAVERVEGTEGKLVVSYSTAEDTAKANEDFIPVNGTIEWVDQAVAAKTIQIPIISNPAQEEAEKLLVTLTSVGGETIQQAAVTIQDVIIPSSVQFMLPTIRVNESDSKVILRVTRAASNIGVLSVDYTTENDTAVAGEDYTATQGALTWADGETMSKLVEIPILLDSIVDTDEVFYLVLSNLQGQGELKAQKAVVTIKDTPNTGNVQFSTTSHEANEGATALLTVDRVGGTQQTVSVSYATSDGTALTGKDYATSGGQLTWVEGDGTSQQIQIPITADSFHEGKETFTVNLYDPQNGVSIGANNSAAVTIIDDFATPGTAQPGGENPPSPTTPPDNITTNPGVVQFTQTSYPIATQQGDVTISVTRHTGSQGFLRVQYQTENDTAQTSHDYLGTLGELSWRNGEIGEKTFSIGLLQSADSSVGKQFKVKLTILEGSTALGIAEAIVSFGNNSQPSNGEKIPIKVGFIQTELNTNEGSDAVVGVTLEGVADETITVNYETIDGTTEINKDYLPAQGELTWKIGETGEKTFSIAILQDNFKESDEDFHVYLTQLRGQAEFGETGLRLTILSNTIGSCIDEELVNCDITGKDLDNVTVTEGAKITGGRLSGNIQCFGTLKDVTLAPDAKIFGQGCTLEGSVDSQEPAKPGTVTNVDISAGTVLRNLIIGKGSIVDPEIIIGENVLFEDNFSIPNIDLTELLDYSEKPIFGLRGVKLLHDLLVNSAPNGILDAINGIHEFVSQGIQLTQHPKTGMLYVDVQNIRYAVLPVAVRQILRKQVRSEANPMGMKIFANDDIIFTTHSGREIMAYPIIQAPEVFEKSIINLGLGTVTINQGNIKVQETANSYFVARPALFAEIEINNELAEGIHADVSGLVKFIFRDEIDQLRHQWLYPAPTNPTALMTLSGMQLTADGQVKSDDYHGVLSYYVSKQHEGTNQVQILEVADLNDDGLNDFEIIYPNGDTQVMFQIEITP